MLFIKVPHLKNDWVSMAMLSAVTTAAYGLFGYLAEVMEKIEEFVVLNSYDNSVIHITIDANINSFSNIIFIFLAQFGVLYIIRVVVNKNRRSK